MVVFLDTSGTYALADRDDPNHRRAVELAQAADSAGETWLVHSYILVESAALMHRRLGWGVAEQFLGDLDRFTVRWVDGALHREAVRQFVAHQGRYSLVDEVSFLVMREAGVRQALAFDSDFTQMGFTLYRATGEQ